MPPFFDLKKEIEIIPNHSYSVLIFVEKNFEILTAKFFIFLLTPSYSIVTISLE